MRNRVIVVLLLAAIAQAIVLSCSSKNSPTESEPPGGTTVVDTGGISVISGVPTDTAAAVLPAVAPHPASPDKIDADGFMRTRLQGILNPKATVENVNSALATAGATITFFDTSFNSISLRIPEQTTRQLADSLAASLVNSDAFLFLFAGQAAGLSGTSSITITPQRPPWTIRHLTKMRMPAAWNVRELASKNAQQVRVIVPDQYASSIPHPEIPAQSFLAGRGVVNVSLNSPNGIVVGNHGFHVAGTIAAAFDNSGSTGIHPGALQDISVLSLKIGGFGFNEIMAEMSASLPAMPCLVSTSLAYNASIDTVSKLQRALDAILWRGLVATRQNSFLMFAAAGNNGRSADDSRFSQYSLPWNLAAAYASPDQMVPSGITVAERQRLNDLFEQITTAIPAAANALTNVVVVGSSDTLGNLSAFSNTPSDVRAVGEVVCAPCQMDDPGVDTTKCRLSGSLTRALYSGTSMATPQIAGLAAYLWNLDPTLSTQDLKQIVTRSYDSVTSGVIDAYRAVLSLDKEISDAPVRVALMDVSGSAGAAGSDGKFDEKDLALWFSEFDALEQDRAGGADPFDYSRYDLNGNGVSAIKPPYVYMLKQQFDLDVNNPPQFTTVTALNIEGQEIQYHENAVTDLDILCYNAYSALYTGDEQKRTQLCIPCLGEVVVYVALADTVSPSTPCDIAFQVWRKTSANDSIPVRGVDLDVSIAGATPLSFTGTTNGTGSYTDQITPMSSADSVVVHVNAKLHDVVVASDTVSAIVRQSKHKGKLIFTRRHYTTKSEASATNSPNGGEDIISNTSTSLGQSSETTARTDASSGATTAATASNTCTRSDSVSVSIDSSLMTITQSVVTSSESFGSSLDSSASWGAVSRGIVDQYYDFTVSGDSVDFTITAAYDYSETSPVTEGVFSYQFQLFEMFNGTPIPRYFIEKNSSDPMVNGESLQKVIPIGDYRIRVYAGALAAVTVVSRTVTLSSELSATTTITIGPVPLLSRK